MPGPNELRCGRYQEQNSRVTAAWQGLGPTFGQTDSGGIGSDLASMVRDHSARTSAWVL